MNQSADVRRENKRRIYRLMLDGKAYTKQQVSAGTGLSVATCNILLNDMAAQGILTGGEKRPGEVGRSAVLYRVDPNHEQYLTVYFEMDGETRLMETAVFSATGEILSQKTAACDLISQERLTSILGEMAAAYPALSQIILGVPGIAEHGLVRHCDISELEDLPLCKILEEAFGLPAAMENDMHHKAYGYYRKTGSREDVITLGYFPKGKLPGTATIHKGTIIRGANSIAGMAGFLPYGGSREELVDLLTPERCAAFVADAINAIIALLNPGTIVLTGDLLEVSVVEQVKARCVERIPAEYLPEFRIVDSLDGYYLEGMYRLAVERKPF